MRHPDDAYVGPLKVGGLIGAWLRHRQRVKNRATITATGARQAETNRLLAEQNDLLRQQAEREGNQP